MTNAQRAELSNLFHLASTALAYAPRDRQTPYDRKLWAATEFCKRHAGFSHKAAYLAFERD